jgi:glyoxylate reductase
MTGDIKANCKVMVTHELIEGGLDPLEGRCELVRALGMSNAEVRAGIEGFWGLVPLLTVKVDQPLLDAARGLKVIANVAVGYDNIDVAAATARGIWVTNTPGVLTEATADFTWALILGLVRRIVEGQRMMLAGAYHGWEHTMLLGADVAGKVLGVVGLGQIGRAVARRAAGFGMPVLFADPAEEAAVVDLGLLRAQQLPLDELLGAADIISLHTPLTPQTRHLIDARRLALMRPSAYLINTSRGPVVDERALVTHLQQRRIAGAALDVYEEEPAMAPGLDQLDNVLLQPHLGSATHETRLLMARTAANNVLAVLEGQRPPNAVNDPLA